jgi:hypothetical protein
VRAELYDKEDGHLVGLRDFGHVTKQELEPNEKSTYKIPFQNMLVIGTIP